MAAPESVVIALAQAFDRELRKVLDADQYAEVLKRNAGRYRLMTGVCASHDFCDANMAMAEAFETAVGVPVDIDSDTDLRLWEAAWFRWKDRDFPGAEPAPAA